MRRANGKGLSGCPREGAAVVEGSQRPGGRHCAKVPSRRSVANETLESGWDIANAPLQLDIAKAPPRRDIAKALPGRGAAEAGRRVRENALP